MLVCRGKSVPLPTNAVRAYRISTIVDAQAVPGLGLAAVRAYRISTIVDDTAEGLLLARTVKAY